MAYNYDSVQELLSWARNMLQDRSYPPAPYFLSRSIKILDCAQFLESLISIISSHWENPTFHPAINQLQEFRGKVEGEKLLQEK